ncbi:hypothetical protein G7054_g10161 [Neopestalotiopsis clavispora]|nr:hypothetical protein G7054_g10161 [Neopestalotiopsis clavispora]
MANTHSMAAGVDPSTLQHPKLLDLTAENITENTLAVNANTPDLRFKYLLERLVIHLHDFVRETRLSTSEWQSAIEFLTAVGQTCTDVRQEFILLSDVLGLSLLVDAVNHPKPPGATDGTVLGPFHTHDAEVVEGGSNIADDPEGSPLLVLGKIRDTTGRPIPGVMVDVWETDSSGNYDVQHNDYGGPNCRGILKSDEDGIFWFKAIVPVSYPTLYLRADPYIFSDAVFGVKDSLIIDPTVVDAKTAAKYGVQAEKYCMIEYDFTLVTENEASTLRTEQSMRALESLGLKCRLFDGLPVPDLD